MIPRAEFREDSRSALCRKSPLLTQRTRAKWGTRKHPEALRHPKAGFSKLLSRFGLSSTARSR
jgi:hypothetical protein